MATTCRHDRLRIHRPSRLSPAGRIRSAPIPRQPAMASSSPRPINCSAEAGDGGYPTHRNPNSSTAADSAVGKFDGVSHQPVGRCNNDASSPAAIRSGRHRGVTAGRARPSGPGTKISLDVIRPPSPSSSTSRTDATTRRPARDICFDKGEMHDEVDGVSNQRMRRLRRQPMRGGKPDGDHPACRRRRRVGMQSAQSEPGFPEPIAVSIGISSSPRTSPTRMRRAFIRNACVINTAKLISPAPSAFASRASNATTRRCRSGNRSKPQLGFLLQHDNLFQRVKFGGQCPQQGRLAGVQPAGHHNVLPCPAPPPPKTPLNAASISSEPAAGRSR